MPYEDYRNTRNRLPGMSGVRYDRVSSRIRLVELALACGVSARRLSEYERDPIGHPITSAEEKRRHDALALLRDRFGGRDGAA